MECGSVGVGKKGPFYGVGLGEYWVLVFVWQIGVCRSIAKIGPVSRFGLDYESSREAQRKKKNRKEGEDCW